MDQLLGSRATLRKWPVISALVFILFLRFALPSQANEFEAAFSKVKNSRNLASEEGRVKAVCEMMRWHSKDTVAKLRKFKQDELNEDKKRPADALIMTKNFCDAIDAVTACMEAFMMLPVHFDTWGIDKSKIPKKDPRVIKNMLRSMDYIRKNFKADLLCQRTLDSIRWLDEKDRDEELRKLVVVQLRSSPDPIRKGAILAMRYVGNEEDIDLLIPFLSNGNSNIRLTAASSIATLLSKEDPRGALIEWKKKTLEEDKNRKLEEKLLTPKAIEVIDYLAFRYYRN